MLFEKQAISVSDLEKEEAAVAQRRLDVAKTEIRAPFDGRISRVNVERLQFALAGAVLLEAESIERA